MSEVNPKEYHLNSFQDIFNVVTPENYECLITDISETIKLYVEIKKENLPLKINSMVWIDDNKTGITEINITEI